MPSMGNVAGATQDTSVVMAKHSGTEIATRGRGAWAYFSVYLGILLLISNLS